ncbi:MAG TPA: hypothetical protein ENK58_04710 [Desulfobacterales bacterium]|nr:hypothetical protein [Desulfobacterales bacterium]
MYKTKLTLIVLSSLLLLVVSTAFAGPKITKVELSQAVADGYYVVALDTSNPYSMVGFSPKLNGIWVNPEETSGDESTTINSSMANVSAAAMLNAGNKSVYPAILLTLPADDSLMTTELSELVLNPSEPVISANADINQIPTNKANIDLSRAIPAGTEVKFTVDMDGEPLHALAITGGTNTEDIVKPEEVTYDTTGNGTLTFKTTTFGTTNAAGQTLNSTVSFLLVTNSQGNFTNSQGESDTLRIIIQTNHWGGDIVPFPMMTDGTIGTVETMCGITAYGPVGESREIYFFFPNDAIDPVFGSGSNFQPSDLAMFLDSQQQDAGSVTLEYPVTKLGKVGTVASASYTFSATSGRAARSEGSEKNVSVGIRSDAEVCVIKDLDGDRKAGLAEVIDILQTLTESETSGETR